MGYIQEEHGSTILVVVDLEKATLIDAGELKTILFQIIESGWRKMIIDLTECEFIDSTFLGTIVISFKKITELGGKLKVVGVQSDVKSMFQLTRVNKIFEVFESREDALESFM
jgi:anti-sigma B factor antagonist